MVSERSSGAGFGARTVQRARRPWPTELHGALCLLHRRDFSKQHAIEGELQVKKRPPQHCGPKMRPPPDPMNCLEASVLSSNGLAVIKASLAIVFSDRGLLLGNLQEAQW